MFCYDIVPQMGYKWLESAELEYLSVKYVIVWSFLTTFVAMEKLKKIFIGIVFLALSVNAYSQGYLKMNALYATVGVINPQLEVVISPHSTMSVDITFSPWRRWNGNHSQFGMLMSEYRYYFKQATRGWYLGANAAMIAFDLNRPQFWADGHFISRQSDYGKGFSLAFGVSAGWAHWLSDRWIFDVAFAFDRVSSWYNRYSKDGDIEMNPQGHEHYEKPDPFNGSLEDIPLKLAVSFGYRIFKPKDE
ncbi:MAG: DUF3575 domain-containing protein [Alistipes sp.]|nr:DUF3575 domain-containing protein [Alistipes sp.]